MKKNILLILMFITMFFIGGNEAKALVCEVGQSGCTIEAIKKDLGEKQTVELYGTNNELACLYEIKNSETNKNYYSYIYNDIGREEWFADSTFNNKIEGYLETIEKDTLKSDVIISEDAYDKLKNNKECPSHAYFDRQENEVCFDNNSECKNNGNKINGSTNVNRKTGTFEGSSPQKFPTAFSYMELTKNGYCKTNDIPEQYNGVCAYVDGKTGDYIYVLYNNNTTRLIYNRPGYDLVIVDKDQQYQKYGTIYENKIETINSCPSNIYLNKSNKNVDENTYSVYSFDKNSKSESITYTQVSCGTGTKLPSEQSCESLIDEELAEIINDIMTIISIGVPILLIGLLTYDFAKAVFAGDEKEVSKVRGTAIKRIIIAIVIFFVPTLLNLVFDLVNTVWEKNFEICVIDEKK